MHKKTQLLQLLFFFLRFTCLAWFKQINQFLWVSSLLPHHIPVILHRCWLICKVTSTPKIIRLVQLPENPLIRKGTPSSKDIRTCCHSNRSFSITLVWAARLNWMKQRRYKTLTVWWLGELSDREQTVVVLATPLFPSCQNTVAFKYTGQCKEKWKQYVNVLFVGLG